MLKQARQASAVLILAAGLALPAAAQAPGLVRDVEEHSRALYAVEQMAAVQATRADKAAKAAAERRQREFTARLIDFTNSWNRLIQLADRGAWNAKQARKTHDAFERLVRCEGWIEASKPPASEAAEASPPTAPVAKP